MNELRKHLLKIIRYLLSHTVGDILPVDTAIQINYSFIYSRVYYAFEVYDTACVTVLKPIHADYTKEITQAAHSNGI